MFAPDDRDRQMVHSGPTSRTTSQNFGGVTPLHIPRNARPCL
jgi:hypothetical protein